MITKKCLWCNKDFVTDDDRIELCDNCIRDLEGEDLIDEVFPYDEDN